jgi:ribosomal protein S18 acetylase RimI-like enzyme
LHDNTRALTLYWRLGFEPRRLIPLAKRRSGRRVDWLPIEGNSRLPVDKFLVELVHRPD